MAEIAKKKKPPFRLGDYIVVDAIAQGGMAQIYLAKRAGDSHGKFFAIKMILPEHLSKKSIQQMFEKEAKIMLNLSHNNLISNFDYSSHDGAKFLVMEYVMGESLAALIKTLHVKGERMPLEHLVFIIREAALGLDHAHKCIDKSTGDALKIIHRDISPHNIMLTFEGGIKVIDFGIAKSSNEFEQTKVGTIKGKYGYLSPEQAQGLHIDHRTDVFSLGIVFWELLTGRRLFLGKSEIATIKNILKGNIKRPKDLVPEIPRELERICLTCLASNREMRYPNLMILSRDLSKFLSQNYPNFSSYDFSNFMRSTYSTKIIELRKALATYSKIEIPKDAPRENPVQASSSNTSSGASNFDLYKTKIREPSSTAPRKFDLNKTAAGKPVLASTLQKGFELDDSPDVDTFTRTSTVLGDEPSKGFPLVAAVGGLLAIAAAVAFFGAPSFLEEPPALTVETQKKQAPAATKTRVPASDPDPDSSTSAAPAAPALDSAFPDPKAPVELETIKGYIKFTPSSGEFFVDGESQGRIQSPSKFLEIEKKDQVMKFYFKRGDKTSNVVSINPSKQENGGVTIDLKINYD